MSTLRPASRLGRGAEFDRIREILDNAAGAGALAAPSVLRGPGDDCAVVIGERTAISTDIAVEDVHFRRSWLSPEAIGYRSAAAALSDLAPAAAAPIGLVAAIAVPSSDGELAVRIMNGVTEAAAAYGAALLGGDVSAGASIVIAITVLGSVERIIDRSGARPGDGLWVTGSLGGAAAAVRALAEGTTPGDAARSAFESPRPRIAEARWLADAGMLHAAIDVSDGVAADAGHLSAASDVRIIIEPDRVPVHVDADTGLALRGGDDYELLFSAPAELETRAAEFSALFRTALTRIGRVEAGSGVRLRDPDGTEREPPGKGYVHFESHTEDSIREPGQ